MLKIDLLATRLEVQDGRLTGKINQCNCHGQEKVRRIQAQFALAEYDKVLAYGDTAGDKPMLKLADTSYYKPFR
jgi:phosphoserine phosphatase